MDLKYRSKCISISIEEDLPDNVREELTVSVFPFSSYVNVERGIVYYMQDEDIVDSTIFKHKGFLKIRNASNAKLVTNKKWLTDPSVESGKTNAEYYGIDFNEALAVDNDEALVTISDLLLEMEDFSTKHSDVLCGDTKIKAKKKDKHRMKKSVLDAMTYTEIRNWLEAREQDVTGLNSKALVLSRAEELLKAVSKYEDDSEL